MKSPHEMYHDDVVALRKKNAEQREHIDALEEVLREICHLLSTPSTKGDLAWYKAKEALKHTEEEK